MGCKRWLKRSLELLVLCFLHRIVLGDGEVGCLFSKNVCRTGVEICYDDAAFGRCVRAFEELDEEEAYAYRLDARELELLRMQLEDLFVDGYEWSHPYTQCIIQTFLYNHRYGLKDEFELCRELKNVEETVLKGYRDDDGDGGVDNDEGFEEPDPQPLAVVNFTPIRGHGYGDFANEKYYPPESSRKAHDNGARRPFKDNPDNDYIYGYSSFRKKPKVSRVLKFDGNTYEGGKNSVVESDNDDNDADKEDRGRSLIEMPKYSMNVEEDLNELSRNFRELSERTNSEYERPLYRLRRQPPRWNDNSRLGLKLRVGMSEPVMEEIGSRDGNENLLDKIEKDRRWKNTKLQKSFWNLMRINDSSTKRNEDDRLSRIEFLREDDEDKEEEEDGEGVEGERNEGRIGGRDNEDGRRISGMYTEGGFVQPMDLDDVMRQGSDDVVLDDDDDEIDKLLWSRNFAAFQRPERVDVKKPGPLYSTNNYAFKTESPPPPIVVDEEISSSDIGGKNYEETNKMRSDHTPRTYSDVMFDGVMYKNVDADYIHIQFNNEFEKWADGKKIVDEIAKLVGLSRDAFSDIRVGRAEIRFKINRDFPIDAMTIAPMIAGPSLLKKLEKTTGMEVTRIGLGDEVRLPSYLTVEEKPKPMSPGMFGATVAAGGAAAVAAATVILVIAGKHAKSRAKLAGLATPDPEASKDYQDLCRARMQAKQPNEQKPESPRIVSLSRESESNRSSTSSWGEEAAALTNMDIATGHMVLTYMEDRLKNKDRLDKEWAAISDYEVHPDWVLIASDQSNVNRNRPFAALTYDHSRVVLNELSNASNSDYINASAITDHDARNSTYIATQGPLPQTSADFWQLVWEQGSVVIVMLTRLTEEGRGMCHRYWPEEGSELYHIYEVHLVSEHIWCDDYLVRSFYLKNLRTGETRTVTQFHFLSWPENGVPQSTKALLEFRRKVNKSYRGRSCPIVVHCSDGAGRTGTYCLIDVVLNRMAKGAKEIDIAAALKHIRDQRPGMVATKQQYEFVLVAVAEEVHAILKALPVQTITEKSQISNVIVTPASASQSSSGSEQ